MTDTQGQGSPVAPSNNVSALVEAIDARARQAGSEGAATLLRGTLSSVSEVLTAIQDRLDRLEDLLADRPEPATSISDQVQAGLASFNARLGRLEEAFVRAVEDSGSGTDVVEQLRQTVLGALQEAPVPDDPRLDALAARLEGLDRQLADQADVIRRLVERVEAARQMVERVEEAGTDELVLLRRSLESLVEAQGQTPVETPGDSGSELADQVKEVVRREAELLTQRVAALAVGVEATRALLEQHVEETENSLGRKASEVTRRLASDLGLRSRRAQPGGGRRDPRQLGPGP
ncbi:MAG: hypothetical protein M3P34_11230 [Actinomycetota bacterium]|nr:hypothetical protein [Actinomycetota bacterium]